MIRDGIYDVAIVGGGINGAAIAAEAATRGLRVLLCEQQDLASATSSASSKLIHGGLRYLEFHEFGLVKEALNERENLLKNAKHLVKPLNFIFPYRKINHSKFLIRLGLFIYDHLARDSTLSKTKTINLRSHPAGKYIKEGIKSAFQYADCQTNDARLVIENALQAFTHQAKIMNYTQCIKASPTQNHWELILKNTLTQETSCHFARCLINATGPWVMHFLHENSLPAKHDIVLVKGSHIVVKKLYEEEFAFILQHEDQRIIFILPYLEHFHLIGTTDIFFPEEPGKTSISEDEINYLLEAVGIYLNKPVDSSNIVHTFSGIRPLLKGQVTDPTKMTRDFAIEINYSNNLPFISLFGGKLTTHRKVAESTIDLLQPFFSHLQESQSANIPLPGSNYINDNQLRAELSQHFPWLKPSLLNRYMAQYGTNTFDLLSKCKDLNDLGVHFGAELYQKEVDYLIEKEWSKTAEDILWRRTTAGYFFNNDDKQALDNYIKEKLLFT